MRVGRNEPGRGAWLCVDSACFDLAVRRRALAKALRTELTDEEVSKLRVRLYGAEGGERRLTTRTAPPFGER